jgi:hypothetical protein
MALTDLSKSELEETLKNLRRLHEAANREHEKKYIQYQELGRELNSILDSAKSFRASIIAVEKALGLSSEQIPLPEEKVKLGTPADATKTVMRVIAEHNESGGVTFDQILRVLRSEGHKTKRDYLHTILSRKKNYQKKLTKQNGKNGKWFLTDLGKEDLGIK